jgi:carboxylesterase type B
MELILQGHVLGFMLENRKNVAQSFIKWTNSNLEADVAADLLQVYGLSADLPDPEARSRILDILTGVGFYAPAVVYARAFEGKSHLLHFDERNSFPGPMRNRCTHGLELVYILQNYNEYLSHEQIRVGEEFARRILQFVSNKEPWKRYDSKGTAFVLGDGRCEEIEMGSYDGRRKELWNILERVGGDKLTQVVFGFLTSAE